MEVPSRGTLRKTRTQLLSKSNYHEWVTRVNFGCNCFQLTLNHIWDKVFKNGPSKISGRQPLKNLKGYGLLKQAIRCKFFIGCHAQISLGPFSNTLSQSILLILKN